MVEYRLMATPLDPKCQIRCDEENCEQVDQSLIGSLMYIALYTRPDILHVNYHKEILIHIESTWQLQKEYWGTYLQHRTKNLYIERLESQ